MNKDIFAEQFPFGSHLCREPMPSMQELKHDMELLKKNNFNLVKLQEHWMIDEAKEGEYDFSKYEELIEYAASLDMGVYLGLTCEQAPGWLYEKYPDCRMVDRNGQTVMLTAQTTLPADGKPGPCCDHKEAFSDQLRFIRNLVAKLAKYENIVIWNTWQEIGYFDKMLLRDSICYCKNTIAAYRDWLKSIFNNDLDSLNTKWNARYSDWHYIEPERGIIKYTCPQEITWGYFMNNIQISNILQQRYKAIKENDPLDRPIFAHKGGPVIGSSQDWTFGKCQDFLGSSCYPGWKPPDLWDDEAFLPSAKEHLLRHEIVQGVAMSLDYIRSANQQDSHVWAAEFQGGPISTGFHKSRTPDASDIRRWVFNAVGAGISGISFWISRSEIAGGELNGFALLDSVGDSTERFEEAGNICAGLQKHADLFKVPSRPSAKLAILIDEWNYQTCGTLEYCEKYLNYDIRGWYRLLWDSGFAVDFISSNDLPEKAATYNALIFPFPLAISEETAEQLKEYVENGGNLISGTVPGRINDVGFNNRGEMSPFMSKLFGVQQDDFKMVGEPEDGERWKLEERSWGDYREAAVLDGKGIMADSELRANLYLQTFLPDDSTEVIFKTGDQVSGTRRHVQRGYAWLLGSFIGFSGTAYRDVKIHDTIEKILNLCEVYPEHEGQLIKRRRVIDNKEAWIFFNLEDKEIKEMVNISPWSKVETLSGELLESHDGTIELSVLNLDVRIIILTK